MIAQMLTIAYIMISPLNRVQVFSTIWTITCQAFLSNGILQARILSGLPCPALRDLTDPGIKPLSLMSSALSSGFFTTSTTWKTPLYIQYHIRSVTQSCLTLCDPMNHSTPGLPVHHQLPEFTHTHVHRVSDAI